MANNLMNNLINDPNHYQSYASKLENHFQQQLQPTNHIYNGFIDRFEDVMLECFYGDDFLMSWGPFMHQVIHHGLLKDQDQSEHLHDLINDAFGEYFTRVCMPLHCLVNDLTNQCMTGGKVWFEFVSALTYVDQHQIDLVE